VNTFILQFKVKSYNLSKKLNLDKSDMCSMSSLLPTIYNNKLPIGPHMRKSTMGPINSIKSVNTRGPITGISTCIYDEK